MYEDEFVEYDRFEDDYNVWEENQIAQDNEGGDGYLDQDYEDFENEDYWGGGDYE